ncbi:uncharacterized membrane protein YdcZ (DUF606 family) [Xanthomonas arboricola]
MRIPLPGARAMALGPWWLRLGGIAGVVYLANAVSLPARIGTAAFIMWIIAGQMLASVIIDRFGMLGMERRPASLARIAGASTIVIGLLISRFGETAKPLA